jgi:hypothetical protein
MGKAAAIRWSALKGGGSSALGKGPSKGADWISEGTRKATGVFESGSDSGWE